MTTHLEITPVRRDGSKSIEGPKNITASVRGGELRDSLEHELGSGWKLFLCDVITSNNLIGIVSISNGLLNMESEVTLPNSSFDRDRGKFVGQVPVEMTSYNGKSVNGKEYNAVFFTVRVSKP